MDAQLLSVGAIRIQFHIPPDVRKSTVPGIERIQIGLVVWIVCPLVSKSVPDETLPVLTVAFPVPEIS